VRIRIPEERLRQAEQRVLEMLGEEDEEAEVAADDVEPDLTLTTHKMYSTLGKHMELVGGVER
jgi:hypothetical protein